MPAFLAEMLSQLRAIWSRLDAGQRLTVAAVLIGTLAGIGGIVWYSGRPDYQVVFSSAEGTELMQAGKALEQSGVSYNVTGNALMVESRQMDTARRALGSAGIGGSGGSLGDLGNVMADRATREHGLSRMVERDAETKLIAIQGVIAAQVSHSKPKRSPYKAMDHETQPRANVGLRLSATHRHQFRSIAEAAVDQAAAALGMPPEYITVTELVTTEKYTRNADNGGGIGSSDFLAQQRRRSEELTLAAQSLLDLIYPDKAIVRVSVMLDPDFQQIKERSAPDKQTIIRSKTTKESTNGTGDAAGGDPSVAGAVGTAAASATLHKLETKETEYAADGFKETLTTKLAPDIKSVSVALVIDEAVAEDAAITAELESTIKSAIGWSNEFAADSTFTIHKTKIPEAVEAGVSSLPGALSAVERWGPPLGQLLGVVLVLLFLRGLLKKRVVPAGAGGSGAAAVAGSAGAPEVSELPPDEQKRRRRAEIERTIAEDPAAMSKLLESWLLEQKS